jgi:hypothetical protein
MQGIAHISFGGGGLILPAQTPYERQLVFEHVEATAKRHEHVELSAEGRQWRIGLPTARRELCCRCLRSLNGRAFRTNGQSLCAHCARRALM